MNLQSWMVLLGVSAVLGGCVTMSESQCRTADWRTVGYHDGESGYPRERLADHQESCAKAGVLPDAKAYFAGHTQGLWVYCTPENALRVGLAGESYRDVCPPELAPGFVPRYRAAKDVHDQRARVDSLDSRRKELEHKLEKAANDDERRSLRNQLRDLDHETRRERDRLADMEHWLYR